MVASGEWSSAGNDFDLRYALHYFTMVSEH